MAFSTACLAHEIGHCFMNDTSVVVILKTLILQAFCIIVRYRTSKNKCLIMQNLNNANF